MKSGRVVIVLAGRYAGRKAVVVKAADEGSDSKKFGHAVGNHYKCMKYFTSNCDEIPFSAVAGIDRYPRKVVRAMSKKKIEKRTKVKPFVKAINYNHLMPTRYTADFELKKVVDDSALNAESRTEVRKQVKKVFEEKYRSQTAKTEKKAAGVQYFFTKLRF